MRDIVNEDGEIIANATDNHGSRWRLASVKNCSGKIPANP